MTDLSRGGELDVGHCQRALLIAHDEYLAALRLHDRRAADEFVRSRRPLIEAMAVARDRLSGPADVAQQFESAVAQ